jgi:hypothetical protein
MRNHHWLSPSRKAATTSVYHSHFGFQFLIGIAIPGAGVVPKLRRSNRFGSYKYLDRREVRFRLPHAVEPTEGKARPMARGIRV